VAALENHDSKKSTILTCTITFRSLQIFHLPRPTTAHYSVTVYKSHSLLAATAFGKTFLKKANSTMDENMNPTK
jgi:hypothetical protein